MLITEASRNQKHLMKKLVKYKLKRTVLRSTFVKKKLMMKKAVNL